MRPIESREFMSAVDALSSCSRSLSTIPRTILCRTVKSRRSTHSVSEKRLRRVRSAAGARHRDKIFVQALSAEVLLNVSFYLRSFDEGLTTA